MVRISTIGEIQAFDDEKYLDNISKISEDCRKRGYHRVQEEPTLEKPTVCYDCSLLVWHRNKNINNIDYRLEPL